jgi:hypothetical protein
MTVPPNAAGYAIALLSAFFGDRIRSRGIIVSIMGVFGTIGFVMQYASTVANVRYGSLFFILVVQGTVSPTCVASHRVLCDADKPGRLAAWCSNNASPSPRRAAALPYICACARAPVLPSS